MATKALITGGAGFVGRHLTMRLLSMGWQVDIVDPIYPGTGAIHPEKGWPFGDPRKFKGFSFFKEDCRDFFRKHKGQYDYAYHLAAIVGGRFVGPLLFRVSPRDPVVLGAVSGLMLAAAFAAALVPALRVRRIDPMLTLRSDLGRSV